MEATAVEEELNCAVCHQVHQDPVSLPCQHSFCRKCIEDVWTQEVDQDGFSCPQCHQTFTSKPSPKISTPTVPCDHCIDSEYPAEKTCLKCESSFCSFHLRPHLTKEIFKDHKLVNPLADLTHRKCPDHKKTPEFFCTVDGLCVCASCGLLGKHRSHTMVSLDEAEASIKEELKREVVKLQTVHQNCSINQQDLQKSETEIKKLVKELKGDLLKRFFEWRKHWEDDEKYILSLIDEEELRVLSQVRNYSEGLTKVMEQINSLEDEAQNLLQEDCLSFIQNSKQLLSRFTEIQEISFPDAQKPDLNLSNVFQLLKKMWEESKKYFAALEELIQMYDCVKAAVRTAHKNYRQIETTTEFSKIPTLSLKMPAVRPWVGSQKAHALKRLSRETKAELSWLTLDPKNSKQTLGSV
ncbi:E3 ubiquitin/ISG15 ligase TRIM25-like isoform X2 [Chiloscyllium plagiosum]|uniref:E3 ubiquitin/ISG15 ligase TRIM25-like isoform X2 n=1 Tax=Chiloscyllium plagiosum TaxID=36176 RepID=UPI001CB80D5C|nr:E3 ubiquitin/ISG15 ligase TRIM25-like isoform X2 [Chiloscyllium plagiosum]